MKIVLMRGVPAEVRFWTSVLIGEEDDCWPWQLSTRGAGYGSFKLNGKRLVAHRMAWVFTYGSPGDFCVLHSCDNPPCCNPKHLFLGTDADNMVDAMKKLRHAYGERHHSILTEEIVLKARQEYGLGGVTYKMLAAKHGVTKSAMRHAVQGISWGYL